MAESIWWPGIAIDHLYETCPARRRSLPELERYDMPTGQGWGTVDPLGTDVCGWCVRVWKARNPAVPTTEEETH